MPYVSRKQEEILAELQEWSKSQESKIEGTFTFDVYSTNAIEFQKVELELAEVYEAAFGDTTWGEFLDLKAAEHGVKRREATKAVGYVDVTGTGIVKAGSIFATYEDTKFIAVSETKVVESGTVLIEAAESGSSGNVGANTINKIPLNIPGIQSANNPLATADGYDAEDDETLRERFLYKVRYPATSGNPNHYVYWALENSGVGAASCIRCWRGRGTVLVLIVNDKLEPADDLLTERVYKWIESQRPIGVEVTVRSAEPVKVDILANVTGTLDVESFKAYLIKYFRNLMMLRFIDYTAVDSYQEVTETPAGVISRALIGEAIIKAGAQDYDYNSLRLNDKFEDIQLTIAQIPTLGDLTFY